MLHNCNQETVTVVKLGRLASSEVDQVLYLANRVQKRFNFAFQWSGLPLDERYRFPNGSVDLCQAAHDVLTSEEYKDLPRPLLVLSDEPFGDPDHPDEPDWLYFSSMEDDWDRNVTIISTQPLDALPGRTLQEYLLMMLSTYVLQTHCDLAFHSELRGCCLDYCDELADAERTLVEGKLCDECEGALQRGMRQKRVPVETVAAAMRLLNKAVGRRQCMLVTPFDEKFDDVSNAIRRALGDNGWDVRRSDDLFFPRLVSDRILREIMVSDLVVADLSGHNPNVFYEVGVAHVIGNDLVLVMQGGEVPFDLKQEDTIFYEADKLDVLQAGLRRLVGDGKAR